MTRHSVCLTGWLTCSITAEMTAKPVADVCKNVYTDIHSELNPAIYAIQDFSGNISAREVICLCNGHFGQDR